MKLPFGAVVLLCLYFYLLKMGDMRSLYSAANGLWWKMRYRSVAETICNVMLNVSLGFALGVYGIILATIISIITCNFLWSSTILFSNYFGKQKMWMYFGYHARYLLFTVIVCFASYYLCTLVECSSQILTIIIRGSICTAIFAGGFLMVNSRRKLFKDSIKMIKK